MAVSCKVDEVTRDGPRPQVRACPAVGASYQEGTVDVLGVVLEVLTSSGEKARKTSPKRNRHGSHACHRNHSQYGGGAP